MTSIDNFWAVIPAGGAGTRLWPLSRSARPKFLLDLRGSGRTLLQETADRLRPLCSDRLMVTTGEAHSREVARQLPWLPADALCVEPSPRDSMAAIGWAAALIERRDPDAVIGSFAADHVIADLEAFGMALERAIQAAQDDWITTIGIEPTDAATSFGYIQPGDVLPNLDGVRRVQAFVEKPNTSEAVRFVADGYQWNAGMFVARPTTLLNILADEDPKFASDLRRLAESPERLSEVWPELPKIAIDRAVAEPASRSNRVAVVPADLGWNDIGDFDSLRDVLGGDGIHILGDASQVVSIESSGLVSASQDRLVGVIGMEDVVIVDTPDALLVTNRQHAQQVKYIVAALREANRDET